MSNLLEVTNLSKRYGNKSVLTDITFQIKQGQIVGLVGPNGSGKTTLLKSIVGLLQDYQGTLLVDGQPPNHLSKAIVSYLPEKTYLGNWMTVEDSINLFKDFYADFDTEKAWDMTISLNLEKKQKIQTMSKGMQEKLQLLLVMSRTARLYVLDEPIGGVDPAARDYILDSIIKNYTNKSSILLSTHLIHDVEPIFDRVLFLKKGVIHIDDYVDTLREEHNMSIDDLFREVYRT